MLTYTLTVTQSFFGGIHYGAENVGSTYKMDLNSVYACTFILQPHVFQKVARSAL